MTSAPKPPAPARDQLPGALAANAASKPFNLAAPLVVFVVTLVAGAPVIVALPIAMVVYAAAAARTMFDRAETARVEAGLEARAATAAAAAARDSEHQS
jgi:hypothetical protein